MRRGAAGRRVADGNRSLGQSGEELAAELYRRQGFRVLDKNWRVRAGEIDLVLQREGLVVFCEVKSRSSDRFGHPLEAMDHRRRARLRRLIGQWLTEHDVVPQRVRTDLVSVLGADVEIHEGALDDH